MLGKGASLGKEAVLAGSGRAGEKGDFFSILLWNVVENSGLDRRQRCGLSGRTRKAER
jgi:hypothetical protein